MGGIRRALWACAVMMVVLLQAPPAHAWPTTGLSPQELQAIIGRKMPVTHKVGQIDSPEVSLDAVMVNVVLAVEAVIYGWPVLSAETSCCKLSRHHR